MSPVTPCQDHTALVDKVGKLDGRVESMVEQQALQRQESREATRDLRASIEAEGQRTRGLLGDLVGRCAVHREGLLEEVDRRFAERDLRKAEASAAVDRVRAGAVLPEENRRTIDHWRSSLGALAVGLAWLGSWVLPHLVAWIRTTGGAR